MNNLILNGNWVDLLIIAVVIYFISDSWRFGFWIVLFDFISFLISLVIALSQYSFVAELLRDYFTLPRSVANALGFFMTAGISQALIGFGFTLIQQRIPYRFWKKPWSNIAGILPSFGQATVIVAFILTLIVSLPLSPVIKRDVIGSQIGGYLVQRTSVFEARLNEVFGGLAEDALTYLTVRPGSTESIPINSEVGELKTDIFSESEMFKMVNKERKERGIAELKWRDDVVPVARAHATDMWKRNYFGHVSPEGKDAGDRLEEVNVPFILAGENLALAPTLQTAHSGLMTSEGHKRNILDTDFKRAGIGVIDNGIYGKMFVQIFTN